MAPEGSLLVASTGGHLKELHELRPRMTLPAPVWWVTFDDDHGRHLLAGEDVVFVSPVAPRDLKGVLANVPRAARLVLDRRPELVVSTGAAIALSFLPVATALGATCHYVESAARNEGPSMTGRALQRLPGVRLYSQAAWGRSRWVFAGSVFDNFRAREVGPVHIGKVVVTLGTMRYSFRRLVTRLQSLLGPETEVLWQTGYTDVGGLSIDAHRTVPPRVLDTAMAEADLVVAHAGIGSALGALEAGRCPVLVPRMRAHGEHVDDHQHLIASELGGRGLAVVASVDDLRPEHLLAAASRAVSRSISPPPIVLAS